MFTSCPYVYDISGREVLNTSALRGTSGYNSRQVDVSILNNGVYFLKIHSGINQTLSKIVIRK
ncbi:MAG: T9SS type A sorting domain-containing protein [Prolixibacteraceae bacterium]|nr:T9SS type A sorting domain-containing protein [Prolixibacteraceae bacterium]